MRLLRTLPLIAAACATVALAGPVAGAQASNSTIVSTLQAYNAKLTNDEANVLKGQATYDKTGSTAALVKALNHEVGDIHSLTGKLKGESASTPKGSTGKTDVTNGLGLIAKAYGDLAKDISKSSSGHKVSKATVEAAVKTDEKGRKELLAGTKLLT